MSTTIENDDEEVRAPKWTPSPQQMRDYIAREVEMARDNMAKIGARSIGQGRGQTLHSERTIERAIRSMRGGGR